MTKTTINRVTFAENTFKGFNGRTKVDELDLSSYDLKSLRPVIDRVEKTLTDLNWQPSPGESSTTWRPVGENAESLVGDFSQFRDFAGKHSSAVASQKPKAEKPAKAAKVPKEPKPPKAPRAPKPVFNKDGKRTMDVKPEQRIRKTPMTPVEIALDDHVVEKIKSRRMVKYDLLKKVAADNGLTLNGVNNGNKKMNMQNTLKGRWNRGEEVFINGETFENKDAKAKMDEKREAAATAKAEKQAARALTQLAKKKPAKAADDDGNPYAPRRSKARK